MNLETEISRQQLSQQLKKDIDTWCSDHFDDGPRGHLGASQIGNNCSRALWYGFRWIAHKKHDGRQQRLFQRGHFEEPRFCSYLEAIGFKVTLFDENNLDAESKGARQIRISDCKGHFGGSIDGIGEHPKYGKFLTEFKTQGTGKKFTELFEKGVKACKPVHFAQMSLYGFKLGLKYAIYMAVNKNDDDLHVEVVELDWKLAEDLLKKAEMIVFTQEAPAKIAQTASYFECSWCDFKSICHYNAEPLKNCRSCKKCFAKEESSWYCDEYKQTVPKNYLKQGCGKWESLI